MQFSSKKMFVTKRCGAALITSIIFIAIFSALAVSLATMSTSNVQIAENLSKGDRARAAAESGLEVVKQWLSNVDIPGTTMPEHQFALLGNSLQTYAHNLSNVTVQLQSTRMDVPNVNLNTAQNEKFFANITPLPSASAPEKFQVDVTGMVGDISKTIRVNYEISERTHTVFDYGVATKGPLSLDGHIEFSGVNVSVEASVFIVSESADLALSLVGNSQIAGDVSIVNPLANVFLQGGSAGIGGETGQAAVDNHVTIGAPETDFPIPDAEHFRQYITGEINSSTDFGANATYKNVRIVPNTNPHFTGNVILQGVIFVETPNVVTFSGDVDITGIIVGNGDLNDDSGTNQINLTGSVISHNISELPNEPQFAGVRTETGTFLIAPGFSASFGGNFHTLAGAVAANGMKFYGNSGGTINGSVINYADTLMDVYGNTDLYFNRSGLVEIPAGFRPEIIVTYTPSSYSEIAGL